MDSMRCKFLVSRIFLLTSLNLKLMKINLTKMIIFKLSQKLNLSKQNLYTYGQKTYISLFLTERSLSPDL